MIYTEQHVCISLQAREKILTNGSFKDEIEINIKWFVTTAPQKFTKWSLKYSCC